MLEIANKGWLGPALYLALRRADRLNEIPLPVRDYLSFIHDRNCERNRRMRAQLLEAIRALDAAAIEPILLKGAIHLFTARDEELGARMISDLDISIAPVEMARAKSALIELGYCCFGSDRELARPHDVGVIELHDRPSARSARYLSTDLRACSPKAARDGAVARIPTATARALHLIVHDMIKGRDYWSFRIDLRHLQDLAELARSSEGIDWQQLCALLSDGFAREALVVQARALEDLFGVQIPPDLRPGRRAELRHVARLVCAGRGPSASVARLIGNLSRGVHEIAEGYEWRGGWKFSQKVYRRLASRSTGSKL
ncbi:MAG: nucleotidyltransferase family protein [Pseudomonadota bacterium]|nr:nucleotidyltransferase family protein [Pseudomonadota bacterium]